LASASASTMSTSNSSSELKTLTRHEEYYIPTADFSIIVEHIQFRVHRYFFERESKWFSGKLVTPASPGSQPQGSSDSNAVILEDLTPAQFARFLWVFYNPRYSLYEANVEDWEVILKLAERWSFPEVKNLAIRELEQKEMLDVKRIKLYHENNVDRNYLVPRYAALCEREEPLTLAEGMDLGMETTLQIAAGREQARSRLPGGARTPMSPTIHGADLHEVVRELFRIAPSSAEEIPHNSGALKPPPTPTQQPSPPPPNSAVKPQQKKTTASKIQTTTTTTKKGAKGQGTEQRPTTGTQAKGPTLPSAITPSAPQPPAKQEAKTKTTAEESKVVGQEKTEDIAKAPIPAAETDSDSANTTSALVVDTKLSSAIPGGEPAVEPRPDPFNFSSFDKPLSSATVGQPTSLFGDSVGSWDSGNLL